MSVGLEGPSGTFMNPSMCPMCGKSNLPDQQPRTLDEVASEFFNIVTRDGGMDPHEQQVTQGLFMALQEFAQNGAVNPSPGMAGEQVPPDGDPNAQGEYGGGQGEDRDQNSYGGM